MSLFLELQRINKILKAIKENPKLLVGKKSRIPAEIDYAKDYSEADIKVMKNKLKRFVPKAYYKIYPEEVDKKK